MKKIYTTIFVLFIFTKTQAGTEYTLTMSFENLTRSFIVHLPTGYSAGMQLPVVFNLHGYGSNAAQQIFYSRMDLTADANNFICVFPEGLNSSWNSGFAPPYNSSPDDVGFISKIIDTVYQLYGANLSRVYACGMSNGGYQSYRLACDLENRIAAIASVTGSLTNLTAINCVLSRKIPIMEIHGTADPLVDYNGGTGYYGTEATIDFWTNKNSCILQPDTTDVADSNNNDSSTVQKIKYKTCLDGTEVWLYKVTGGGHSWPSAPIDYIYGPTNRDINASQEIWDFFNKFSLNGSVGLVETNQALSISITPNPVSESFFVQGLNFSHQQFFNASIFDLHGKKLLAENLSEGSTQINVQSLSAGMYILRVGEQHVRFTK